MKQLLIFFAFIIGGCCQIAIAQTIYSAQNAHSHNDYRQAVAFYHAFNAGFGAIEADVFKVNGKLLVAHDEKELKDDRTLAKMYLDPIKDALKKDTARHLTLLVDIKQDYDFILPELIKELKPLRKFCKGNDPMGRLFILISGNRPPPELFSKYPYYIYFDEDLKHVYTPEELAKIGQISLEFSAYVKWKGTGTIPATEERHLKSLIDSVHTLGKPIRFWDAPDNAAGWSLLMKLHADVIGTDKIDELTAYLKKQN